MPTHFAAPVEVGFELLRYCNLRCWHCFSESGPDGRRVGLPLSKIESLFDELARLRVFKVYLGGGEPFARKDILDVVRLAAERRLAVSISTNGAFLHEEHVAALTDCPPALVQVSLDGACARTHDAIRGPGSFDKAVRALQRLAPSGLCTAVGTTACQSNFREIPRILRLVRDLGVRIFHLMGLQPAGRGLAAFAGERLTASQWLALHDYFSRRRGELSRELELQIEIDKLVLFQHRPPSVFGRLDGFVKLMSTCPCSRSLCTITAEGDVLPCELMRDVVAGNVYRQSLREIWGGSPAFRLLRKRSLGIADCAGCRFWECCQGGCAAATYNLTGTLDGADPRCELAHPVLSHA